VCCGGLVCCGELACPGACVFDRFLSAWWVSARLVVPMGLMVSYALGYFLRALGALACLRCAYVLAARSVVGRISAILEISDSYRAADRRRSNARQIDVVGRAPRYSTSLEHRTDLVRNTHK